MAAWEGVRSLWRRCCQDTWLIQCPGWTVLTVWVAIQYIFYTHSVGSPIQYFRMPFMRFSVGLGTFPVNYSSGDMPKQYCFLLNKDLLWVQFSGFHTDLHHHKDNSLVSISDEPDTLYRKLSVLVKGHDKTVLDSYEYFAVLAAKELGISIEKVDEPPRKIERFTLLKSIHIFKKHRVQYEMRTHYRCLELKHLTGSTADVYLEYIQRNLPEGVAMEIKKTKLEKLPEHIQKPIWDKLPSVEETASTS